MGRECVEGGVEDRGQVKLSMVLRRNRDPSFTCFTTQPRLRKELFDSVWTLPLSKLQQIVKKKTKAKSVALI